MRQLTAVFMGLALSGCQGFQWQTNLNTVPGTLAAQAGVHEYSVQQMQRDDTELLGALTAQHCQTEEQRRSLGASRSETMAYNDAVSQLKVQVAQMGGNGVVIHQCQLDNTPRQHCALAMHCQASAILVTR